MRSRPRLLGTLLSCALVSAAAPAALLVRSVVDERAPAASAEGGCAEGFREVSGDGTVTLLDVASLPDGRALAVGADRRKTHGIRRAVVSTWDGSAWTTDHISRPGLDSSLLAVAARGDALWAVGFQESWTRSLPLAVRAGAEGWVVDSPPPAQVDAEVLAAVDVDPSGGVWAVGEQVSPRAVRSALVWQRTGTGWLRHRVAVGGRTALSAVVARSASDVWAAGSRVGARGAAPLLIHWDGARWSQAKVPIGAAEGSLFAMAGGPDSSLWAAGWRREGRLWVPLVLQGTADGWTALPDLDTGGSIGIATGISVGPDGLPWVVGAAYLSGTARYVPLAARWNGSGWEQWPRSGTLARYLQSSDGDLLSSGWAVGKGNHGSLRVRLCQMTGTARARANVPRALESPVDRAARSTRRAVGRGDRRAPVPHRARISGAGQTWDHPEKEALPRAAPGLPAATPLDPPPAQPGLVLLDVAAEMGLGYTVPTHGATVGDLDRDGRDDIIVSGHAGAASLFLGTPGGFASTPAGLPKVDRHDCALGPLDGDEWPDVVCTVGADRGVGLKANELWVDPGTGARVDEAVGRGIGDPTGRGRALALFDADGDGDLDMFIGNTGLRYDGQPSPNRLFRNDGDGHFMFRPDRDLTSDRGAWCAMPRDFDVDGDADLVVCAWTGSIIDTAGVVLYRNDGGRFTNVTRSLGVRPIGEVDAEVADLDRDGRPDLVQLSTGRIRVSLARGGRFELAWEREVSGGRALAAGDVDGDGDVDLYLQRAGERQRLSRADSAKNLDDVVLQNDGTGQGWTTLAVPAVAGTGDDVVALDRDQDGRAEFLVLNGRAKAGPLQFIVSAPAGGTESSTRQRVGGRR
jgi:hypothetical protein